MLRVKKFNCNRCGAPKVNAYKNPYIVCDYCGIMIDVDYSAGLQVWNHSQEHTDKYLTFKAKFESDIAKYLAQKNKKSYWKTYYDYWDFYYTHYPEYLPPTITKGEKYDLFIKAAADMAANNMDFPTTKKSEAYNKAYGEIHYYEKDGQNYADYESFIKMINAYLELQEQELRIVYDDERYKIMHEVLPEKFQLKMKLSQIAQVWIPYLEKNNGDRFLKRFDLNEEYVELADPLREKINCEECNKEMDVVKGALVCVCMNCRYENKLLNTCNCHNCGFENELPVNWNQTIKCKSCSSELRVVQPLFS